MNKVSVIVPTYNRPEMLKRALKSVAEQTYQNIEIIVINDGGVDVSDVVNQFENVVYISKQENKGLPAARNTGIRLATGKYITYLDDDDIIYPHSVETMVNALDNNPEKLVYTRWHKWINEEIKAESVNQLYTKNRLLRHNIAPVHCIMHHKDLLDDRMFDESLPNHEDYDLWLWLSDKTDFRQINVITGAYSIRQGSDQMSLKASHIDGFHLVRNRYLKHHGY
mgnify:FL=1